MGTTAYTEEETEQILHALYLEKKRAQELERTLAAVPHSQEEMEEVRSLLRTRSLPEGSLRQSVLALCMRCDELSEKAKEGAHSSKMREIISQLEKQKKAHATLSALYQADKEKWGHLEAELQEAKSSSEGANEEVFALQEQLKNVKFFLDKERNQNSGKAQQIKQLTRSLEEKEEQIASFPSLESRLRKASQQVRQLEKALERMHLVEKEGKREKEESQRSEKQQRERADQVEEELGTILLQWQELKERVQRAEKAEKNCSEQLELVVERLEKTEKERNQAKSDLEQSQEQRSFFEKEAEEKGAAVVSLSEENQRLEKEKKLREKKETDLESGLKNATSQLQAKEAQLQSAVHENVGQKEQFAIAQQHLAKKVQENTRLKEKVQIVEGLEEALLRERQKREEESREKVLLREQLKEKQQICETWEAKEKSWKDAEEELRVLREKQRRLQELLSLEKRGEE